MSAAAPPLAAKRPLVLCDRQTSKRPRLPPELPPHTAFFTDPEHACELAARKAVSTTARFDKDQIPRVWTSGDDKRPKLSYLSVEAPHVESLLHCGGFGELYGIKQVRGLDLSKYGLARLECGTFNQLWKGKMTRETRRCFPPEIATLLEQDRLVIRAPLERTHSCTRRSIIGEMDNVLHAALYGYGPLVAGMTWIRTVHREGMDEGMVCVKYRLVTFMEKGSTSVYNRIKHVKDQGFVPNGHPFATTVSTARYFDSLLRCVHAYSVDRFVYLDATLRNFVDFVGTASQSLVKVVDIDHDVFRRFGGDNIQSKSRAWQLLWLHNTLVVSCFLKRYLSEIGGFTLGARKELRTGQQVFDTYWWSKIERAVGASRRLFACPATEECDAELQRCRAFLSATRRPNATSVDALWRFPETSLPPYASASPCALGNSAMAYCYYYFVRQPLEEVHEIYCKPAMVALRLRLHGAAGVPTEHRGKIDEAHRRGTNWYNAVARRTTLPAALFFHSKLREKAPSDDGSAPLVDIMAEFAATAQEVLERRYAARLVPADRHALSDLDHLVDALLALA